MRNKAQLKLPVIKILLNSSKLPITHFLLLIRMALPFLVVFSFTAFMVDRLNSFIYFAIPVLLLTFAMAIVGFHRVFLLGKNILNQEKTFRCGARELRFIWASIILNIATLTISLPFLRIAYLFLRPIMFDHSIDVNTDLLLLPLPILLGIFIIPLYCFSRWALILPATTVDRKSNLFWAWSLSKGNGWRLTILVILIPGFIQAVFEFLPDLDSLWFSYLYLFIWLYLSIVEIALLSLSYKWLINNNLPENVN